MSGERKLVAVVGAGRMGRGIAHVFAYGGYPVALVDFKPRSAADFAQLATGAKAEIEASLRAIAGEGVFNAALVPSILGRIRIVPVEEAESALREAALVWECVPERAVDKADALGRMSALAPEAIIASTTSTILVTELQRHVARPERFLNAHFLNPAFLIPLVEVSPSRSTDEAVTQRLIAMLEAVGKVPVRCEAVPGYIIGRLQALLLAEAARMVHEGVASAEDIDKAVRTGFGPRFSVMGPIEFIDYGGLDIAFYACHYMAKALNSPRHAPPPQLDVLMREGMRGLREGQGYYDWRSIDTDAYRRRRFAEFVKLFSSLGEMPKPADPV